MAMILLVEDDRALGQQVIATLRQAGHVCTWWHDARAIDEHEMPAFDLVVLDLMLPGGSGFELLRAFRRLRDTPVLILSARNETEDKIEALQLGADDYMTKPFWPEELLARVSARLRRPKLERDGALHIGDIAVDPRSRQVFRGDVEFSLTPVEFDLLLALLRRRGSAVTRGWLARHVLRDDLGERTLDAHVSRLRRKLGDKQIIETVWGVGYRIPDEASACD